MAQAVRDGLEIGRDRSAPELPAMLALVDRRIAASKESRSPRPRPFRRSPPKPASPAARCPYPSTSSRFAGQTAAGPRRVRRRTSWPPFSGRRWRGRLFGVMKYAPEQLNLLPAASGLAGGEALADLARRIDGAQGPDLRSPGPARLPASAQGRSRRPAPAPRGLEQKVAGLPATGGTAPGPALPVDRRSARTCRGAGIEVEQAGPAALSTELSALPARVAVLQQRFAVLEKRAPAKAPARPPILPRSSPACLGVEGFFSPLSMAASRRRQRGRAWRWRWRPSPGRRVRPALCRFPRRPEEHRRRRPAAGAGPRSFHRGSDAHGRRRRSHPGRSPGRPRRCRHRHPRRGRRARAGGQRQPHRPRAGEAPVPGQHPAGRRQHDRRRSHGRHGAGPMSPGPRRNSPRERSRPAAS